MSLAGGWLGRALSSTDDVKGDGVWFVAPRLMKDVHSRCSNERRAFDDGVHRNGTFRSGTLRFAVAGRWRPYPDPSLEERQTKTAAG